MNSTNQWGALLKARRNTKNASLKVLLKDLARGSLSGNPVSLSLMSFLTDMD